MLRQGIVKVIRPFRIKFFDKINSYLLESQQHALTNQLKSCGQDCNFYWPFQIYSPSNLEIGDNVSIGTYVHMWCQGGIKIGNRVLIASHTAITSVTHDHNQEDIRRTILKEVVIEDEVWIGAHSIILPGVRIGKGAVIGANSVVTRNVEPYSIMIGSPAKFHKYRKIANS